MLKNDGATVNALEKQYKATEKDIADLKHELGEVMGANVHGKQGNQLLDDERWNGYAPEEDNRAPNMGDISPAGNAVKPGLSTANGEPLFGANVTAAHVAMKLLRRREALQQQAREQRLQRLFLCKHNDGRQKPCTHIVVTRGFSSGWAGNGQKLKGEGYMAEVSAAALKMCEFVNNQVKNGSIYVLGAQGQTGSQITEAWIKRREHNIASNYNRAIALWKKRLAAGYKNLCAYDCSGLIMKWLIDNGHAKSDKTANGIYFDLCSAISRSALQTGDLVFQKYSSKNRMYHVGIYMGDGTVVHAKGRSDGVVRESISKTSWNRYGHLKSFGSTVPGDTWTRLLKITSPYMYGADVTAVQTELKDKGYDPGGVDGFYGPKTEAAVKAFQKARGLEVDGIVGPKTWEALFDKTETNPDPPEEPAAEYTRLLRYVTPVLMVGEDVRAVQVALKAAGFDPKGIDGSYGRNTEAAVKAFQKADGLEVDGIVGPLTWQALMGREDDEPEVPEEPDSPEVPDKPEVKYTRLLKLTDPYMKGDDVKAVQAALKAAGFDPKGTDGTFGPNTEAAVKAYQKANDLEADGIVGPITWAKLMGDTTLELPEVKYTRLLKLADPYMKGDDVKAVQVALEAAGFDPKGTDGAFGPNTEAAVKAYQKAKGLEVDGIVGPKTWVKLMG